MPSVPKNPGKLDAKLRIAVGVRVVAPVALDDPGVRLHRVEKVVAARLLVGGERVVEVAVRVGWINDLQDEVGKGLHVGGGNRTRRADEIEEAFLELPRSPRAR